MSVLKPLLFNGEMVKALLEGRKTVTRRLLKPQPKFLEGETGSPQRQGDGNWCFKIDQYNLVYEGDYKPPCEPGDILYVRETWAMMAQLSGVSDAGYVYRADYTDTELQELASKHFRWFPSIHMPKKAARIFLKVKGVPYEWPMDPVYCPICKGEGLVGALHPVSLGYMEVDCPHCEKAVSRFANLWNSTIKPGDTWPIFIWDANPWVWVIEFERISREEALNHEEVH